MRVSNVWRSARSRFGGYRRDFRAGARVLPLLRSNTEVATMATAAEILAERELRAEESVTESVVSETESHPSSTLLPWLRVQSINVTRHAAGLRPFKREEFGTGAAAPSEGHIQAANRLISGLRRGLLNLAHRTAAAASAASEKPTSARLTEMVVHKDNAHKWVQGIERIWDFYLELFGQRLSTPYANWLLSCDRIAMDCYRVAYTGLGTARSVPAPPPFCYMRTGFAPATFRRGIPLTRLGKQLNPFGLVQLPYHRLLNPWSLSAICHEIGHNLQSDLGLSREVPRRIALRLLRAGMPQSVAATWAKTNREVWADLVAVCLGGPEVVGSLFDVIGRAPRTVLAFSRRAVHPTPYLRALISVEMLRRMGFEKEAEQYRHAWMRIYPNLRTGSIPEWMLKTFPEATALVVDTICYQKYPALGNKSLSQVVRFQGKDQQMIDEAARRMAAGVDPGIVPERFLIGAARVALNRRMGRPGVIAENFYKELVRR